MKPSCGRKDGVFMVSGMRALILCMGLEPLWPLPSKYSPPNYISLVIKSQEMSSGDNNNLGHHLPFLLMFMENPHCWAVDVFWLTRGYKAPANTRNTFKPSVELLLVGCGHAHLESSLRPGKLRQGAHDSDLAWATLWQIETLFCLFVCFELNKNP